MFFTRITAGGFDNASVVGVVVDAVVGMVDDSVVGTVVVDFVVGAFVVTTELFNCVCSSFPQAASRRQRASAPNMIFFTNVILLSEGVQGGMPPCLDLSY